MLHYIGLGLILGALVILNDDSQSDGAGGEESADGSPLPAVPVAAAAGGDTPASPSDVPVRKRVVRELRRRKRRKAPAPVPVSDGSPAPSDPPATPEPLEE